MTARIIREHENEPVPGLPHALPLDEQVLWRGRPQAKLFARHVFKTRWIAAYFLVLAIASVMSIYVNGGALSDAVMRAAIFMVMAAVVIGLLELTAWGVAKTTVYTLTNKRLVLRVGIALPLTVNIPFSLIAAVGQRRITGDSGNLSFELSGADRISWLMLWPHVRMWKLRHPAPVLRCVARLDKVSEIVAGALRDYQQTAGVHAAPAKAAGQKSKATAMPGFASAKVQTLEQAST